MWPKPFAFNIAVARRCAFTQELARLLRVADPSAFHEIAAANSNLSGISQAARSHSCTFAALWQLAWQRAQTKKAAEVHSVALLRGMQAASW